MEKCKNLKEIPFVIGYDESGEAIINRHTFCIINHVKCNNCLGLREPEPPKPRNITGNNEVSNFEKLLAYIMIGFTIFCIGMILGAYFYSERGF